MTTTGSCEQYRDCLLCGGFWFITFSFVCRAYWLLSLTCTSDTWLMTWIALYCDSSEFLAVLTLPSLTCMSPFPSFPFPPKLPPLPSLYPSLILLPSSSTHSPSPSSFFHRSSSLPNRGDHDSRVEASKMAIVAMLKSWPGVFCLCSPSNSGITSLFSMLPLAKPLVQVSTYHIGSNPDTSCRPCVYHSSPFSFPFPSLLSLFSSPQIKNLLR